MPNTADGNLFDPAAPTSATKTDGAVASALLPTESAAKRAPIYGEDKVAQVNPSATPEDVLDIPPVMAVFRGSPAATYATKEDEANPVVQEIGQRMHDVMAIGLNLYRSYKDDYVLFNPKHIQGKQIKAADQADDLPSVATHISELIGDYEPGTASPEGPVAAAQQGTGQPGDAGALAASSPAASAPPAGGGAQTALMGARLRNLLPTAPTSRPRPGYGNIVNQLLRPTV